MSPRISVLMPIRAIRDENVEWVHEAINSLEKQTFSDWELLIVNDRSRVSLSSLKEIVSASDRIKALKSKQPGVSFARNLAAATANGELLLPMDHDDILPPRAMELLLEAWDKDGKDFGLVYGDVVAFGQDFQRNMEMPQFIFQTLLRTLIMPIGTLHTKDSWEQIGGWDLDFQIGLEDWEYWIRMVINGYHGYHVQATTYHYRRHAHGRLAALRKDDKKFAAARLAIRTKHLDYYNGKEPKMCRGCGKGRPGSFRSSGGVTPTPPPAPAPYSAQAAAVGRTLVKYRGRRGASFGITGKATGWKYHVPGGRGCMVQSPDGKVGVHPNDVQFFRRYDGGNAFAIEATEPAGA